MVAQFGIDKTWADLWSSFACAPYCARVRPSNTWVRYNLSMREHRGTKYILPRPNRGWAKETLVEVVAKSSRDKRARSLKLMRTFFWLSLGPVPLQGKISGRERRSLAVNAPARLTVLAPQSRRQENSPLVRCNQLGNRKSNKNCPLAGCCCGRPKYASDATPLYALPLKCSFIAR